MRLLRGHKNELRAVGFSPDGQTLATAGFEGTVKLWDLPSGKERATLPAAEGWQRNRMALAFSPEGTLLASGGLFLSLWKCQPLELRAQETFSPTYVKALAFSRDSKYLAVGESHWGGPDKRTAGHLWEIGTRRWQRLPGEGVQRAITAVAFLPGHDVLATGQSDRQLLHTRGRQLAYAYEHRVVFWDVNTLRELRAVPQTAEVQAVAFSPDGRILATATGKVVQLYDATNGERRDVLKGHTKQVNALAFTPDGRMLLSGGNDRMVRLWDVASASPRATYDWKIRNVRGVAVAPDGVTAAAVGESFRAILWDIDP